MQSTIGGVVENDGSEVYKLLVSRTVKNVPYQRDLAWRIAGALTGRPLIALLGGDRQLVALAYRDVPLASLTLSPDTAGIQYIGLIGYDDAALTQVFAVDQALIVDHTAQRAYLTGGATLPVALTVPTPADAPAGDLILRPHRDAVHYLGLVREALNAIRDGRFYQVNLLRYFSVLGPAVARPWLLARLRQVGGPMAALIDTPELTLASFSPERFVTVATTAAGQRVSAYPVKGTAARDTDAAADRLVAAALAASPKDRAELSMIVDLMRHDLRRIGVGGSVEVTDPGSIVTHKHVHHLEARVEALLAPGVTVADLVTTICPAGSITGAPKVEVMQAIAAYEERPRRYFMGNLFWLDGLTGAFDSSVLIRTLVREGADDSYTYAAGSGIVTHSDPETERQEIAAKCRVVGRVQED